MVQEGRRRLGLQEYKSRWGLIFALRHNRVTQNKKEGRPDFHQTLVEPSPQPRFNHKQRKK